MELDMEDIDTRPFIAPAPKISRKAVSPPRSHSSVATYGHELSIAIGVFVPLALTTGHMLIFYFLWGGAKPPVNKEACSCSCWDTGFKGPYESGVAHYKHVYFNSTWNTFKMWVLTVIALVAIYESFKRLVQLMLLRKLRSTMGALFLSSLHSNYYAYWVTWNYWNDDFYDQWTHQLFFSLTELFTTLTVFRFLDRRKPVQPLPMLLIANIALFHILTASWDQFVANVLLGGGSFHQVSRDLLIMSTDLIYLAVSLFEVKAVARASGESFRATLFRRKHVATLSVLTAGLSIWFLFFLG